MPILLALTTRPPALITACWCCCIAALAAAEISIQPPLLRLDLQVDQITEAAFTISGPPATTISAVVADCACIRLLSPLPMQIGPAGAANITLRVTGLRPSMEDILVATSVGILRAQVQIVGPGAGRGRDQLRGALAEAATRRCSVVGIVYDLRGHVRHCGCSAGALGGAGRLAHLPALARDENAVVTTTWVLAGEVDGPRQGLGDALAERGWRVGHPSVLVSADPLPLLGRPDVLAVIPTSAVAAEHRRLLRPVLIDGMAAELLLVDAQGVVQARRTMPVDDSLPDDEAFARRFPDPLSVRIDTQASPSTTCATCHAAVFARWQQSRHAHAIDSLPAADRTDSCVGCHTEATSAAGVVAPMVGCQSCHTGTAQHLAASGQVRTTGTIDCRTCHDARHHPAFQRERAWPIIAH